jgi:hypothetical protein
MTTGDLRPAAGCDAGAGCRAAVGRRSRRTSGRHVSIALVGLVSVLAGVATHGAGPDGPPARLTTIESLMHRSGATIVIESSEPAPYIATRPEPGTLLVDLRNVNSAGVVNRFVPDAASPVTSIDVSTSELSGRPMSRVRIRLSQPVAHRVRADRARIIVDLGKPVQDPARAISVLPPLSRQSAATSAPVQAQPSVTSEPAARDRLDSGTVQGVRDPVQSPAVSQFGAAPAAAAQAPQSIQSAPRAPVIIEPGAGDRTDSGAVQAVRDPVRNSGQSQLSAAPPTLAQAPQPAASPQLPAAPAPPPGPQAPAAERRFTGNPVSLDFQDADLRAVLRTFAEISGLNMVIDPTVRGSVDVTMRDVPWDQALDIILRANKLDWMLEGNIVRIAPRDVFTAETKAQEEATRARVAAVKAAADEEAEARAAAAQTTRTIQLSYAKAEEMATLLKSALSARGRVEIDLRTNTLIVRDSLDRLDGISDLIGRLDHPQPQVEIEARIVQTNKNYARALGVQWGFMARSDPSLGNTTNLAFPNNGSVSGRTGQSRACPERQRALSPRR